MKIGVFGDSYAEHCASNPNHLQWWQYVQQQCSDIEIDNYGVAGSSLYYTWKQFQNNQHKYDKVIVYFTTPNRLWMPHLPKEWNLEHVHNLDIFKYRTFKNTFNTKIMKNALDAYYKYIVNIDEQRDIWQLQIESIKRKRPDGLYLASFCGRNTISDHMALHRISLLDGSLMDNQCDLRANHLNDANSKIFAEKIIRWIRTDQFSMSIDDFTS
jgi:hypothetical protein